MFIVEKQRKSGGLSGFKIRYIVSLLNKFRLNKNNFVLKKIIMMSLSLSWTC